MESRKQLVSKNYSGAWGRIGRVFRKHFLIEAGLDWYELERVSWCELSGCQRNQLLAVLAENPRVGPMFGLEPMAGVYKNGVTVAEAYANKTGDGVTFRSDASQAFVNHAQISAKPKPKSKIIQFSDYLGVRK